MRLGHLVRNPRWLYMVNCGAQFLSRCVWAGGLISALTLIGCATSTRTSQERAADTDLAAKVEAALDADSRGYARHVDVRVDRGVVHLGGYIWTDSELRLVKADAAS